MTTTYQVEPTEISEDGTMRKIAFKNTALDVTVGQLSPGTVTPEIAGDPNEVLSRTLANIKAHLMNLKGLSAILRAVSDTDTDTSETNIPSTKVTNSLKTQIETLKASLETAEDAVETKAPINHASSATTYGIGTGNVYGHVKLSDVFGSVQANGAAANGIAASQNAVGSAYAALDAAKAPNDHAVAAATYGKGTASLYGHVKASDVYDTTSTDASEVATRKALYDAYKEITDKVDNSETGLAGKAPVAHASTATTYGVGTGTAYGHLKISDAYNADNSTSGAAANGVAASSWAVYRAYSTLNTAIGGKLGTAHASEKATASAFSHVKLSDAYTSSGGTAAQGVGASSKAVYDAYTALSNSITSLQSSVSSLNTSLAGKANSSHTHDNRYYTESEMTTKLNGKSNTNHTHGNYLTTGGGIITDGALKIHSSYGVQSSAFQTAMLRLSAKTNPNPQARASIGFENCGANGCAIWLEIDGRLCVVWNDGTQKTLISK